MLIPVAGKEAHTATWVGEVSDQTPTTLFVYNAGMANAVSQLLR